MKAGPPHLVLPLVGVAGHTHDPVGLGVEDFQEVGPTPSMVICSKLAPDLASELRTGRRSVAPGTSPRN